MWSSHRGVAQDTRLQESYRRVFEVCHPRCVYMN